MTFNDNKLPLFQVVHAKCYCSFVQIGDTGLPRPEHLVPCDGTTPEGVVVEKIVGCRSILLRRNPYRIRMEKGLELIIV